MPELPEVETLRRGLVRAVSGSRIVSATVSDLRVLKGQSEAEFCARAVGRCIQSVDRRGKYLLMPLAGASSPSVTLCLHLKMRGSIRLAVAGSALAPYHALSLALDGGHEVRYHDMWMWGEVRALTESELSEVAALQAMGDEPLAAGWDGEAFARRLVGRRSPIKAVLLDQAVAAGVGNIYADEALFAAGVDPRRRAESLTAAEALRLAASLKAVLTEAVECGGSRGEYVDLWGALGRYLPQVYDRGGKPCPRCETPLERVRLGGRGTTFCPRCQG